MTQKASIAIFDSGVGGLSVMQKFMSYLPEENIIYFADTACVPYGGKSAQTIIRFAKKCLDYLVRQNIKCVVLACHTLSSVVLEIAKAEYSLPIFGIIEPSCDLLCQTTKNHHVAILATSATIETQKYPFMIKERLPDATVTCLPSPLLVPLVEEGWEQHPIAYEIVREYLLPIKEQNIDTLLLGCTHYKFLQSSIELALKKETQVIDGSFSLVKSVAEILGEEKLLGQNLHPTYRFVVTDNAEKFLRQGQKFLQHTITSMQVEEVTI